jgi:hypothetical protein
MSKRKQAQEMFARKRDRVERDADEMAQLVYAFSTGSW